jgi:hypothetical protein
MSSGIFLAPIPKEELDRLDHLCNLAVQSTADWKVFDKAPDFDRWVFALGKREGEFVRAEIAGNK